MKILTNVTVRGYRNLDNVELKGFGDISILIGPNNSGKSSLLRSIAKLKEQAADRDYQFKNKGLEAEEELRGTWAKALAGFEDVRPRVLPVIEEDLRHGAASFEFIYSFDPTAVDAVVKGALAEDTNSILLRLIRAGRDSVVPVYKEDIENLRSQLPSSFYDMHFSGAFFGSDVGQRNFGWFCLRKVGDALKQRVVFCDDGRLQFYAGKSLEEYVRGTSLDTDQYGALRNWLRDVVDPHIVRYKPNEQRVVMDTGHVASMAALGSGVRSLVCLAVDIIAAPAGSCILIDEPELGLNPAAKQRFLSLLCDQAQQKQFILATHDPTFTNPVLWKHAGREMDSAIFMFSEVDHRFVKVNPDVSDEVAGSFAGYLPHTTSPRDFHLYVEGRTDAQAFRCLLGKCLWEASCWWQLEDRVDVFHLGGKFWEKLLPTVPSRPYTCLVVLDGDKANAVFGRPGSETPSYKDQVTRVYGDRFVFFRGSEYWTGESITDAGKLQFGKMQELLRPSSQATVVYTLSKRALDDYFPGAPPGKANLPVRARSLELNTVPMEIRMLLGLIPVSLGQGTCDEYSKEFGLSSLA